MPQKSMSYRRHVGPKARMTRAAKTVGAADAIGPLVPGVEVYVLTFGQFSLIDALHYLVEQTGPADVDISVWTAAHADLTRSAALLEQSCIRRLRWVVDRSFESRQPAFLARMRTLFGDDSIRVTASHCKFLAIRNERWNLAVRTSMNLNENPRLENLEVSDCPALCGFLTGVVDSIFAECAEGDFRAAMTGLDGVPSVMQSGGVSAGHIQRRLGFPSARSLKVN